MYENCTNHVSYSVRRPKVPIFSHELLAARVGTKTGDRLERERAHGGPAGPAGRRGRGVPPFRSTRAPILVPSR